MSDKQIQKLETLLKVKIIALSVPSIDGMMRTKNDPIYYQDVVDTANRMIRLGTITQEHWIQISKKL